MKKKKPDAGLADPPFDPVQRNIETVVGLEQAAQASRSLSDHLVSRITSFIGSLPFLYWHLSLFALWALLNTGSHRRSPFDPFPFPALTLILAMESVLLSGLILIGQNRQQRLADRRAHLELQINLLAEQETTKVLSMLDAIQEHLGLGAHDAEVAALKQAVQPEQLMEQIEAQVVRLEDNPNLDGQ